MNRTAIVVATVVVLAGAGAWAIFAGSGGPKVVAGAGEYEDQLYACQDKIFEDLQHPLELVFVESKDWHTADGAEIDVGGILQVPNVDGGTDTMEYSCQIRGNKIFNLDIH